MLLLILIVKFIIFYLYFLYITLSIYICKFFYAIRQFCLISIYLEDHLTSLGIVRPTLVWVFVKTTILKQNMYPKTAHFKCGFGGLGVSARCRPQRVCHFDRGKVNEGTWIINNSEPFVENKCNVATIA